MIEQQEKTATRAYHQPVMADEVVSYLITKKDGIYVDATIGGGGHASALLRKLDEGARLIGLDADPDAVKAAEQRFAEEPRVVVRQSSFSRLKQVLQRLNISACNGILADLGISSHQVEAAARGFSYLQDGPLDMRMDPGTGEPAAALLERISEAELTYVLRTFGEERSARKIARAIVQARDEAPIHTTGRLARVVSATVPEKHRIKTLSRVFQALRIAVNRELEELEAFLPAALDLLQPGGRLVVLAYHSLEDRIVKRFMVERARSCICPPDVPVCTCGHRPEVQILTKKPVMPAKEEIQRNPRARSARLRACEKLVGKES